MAVLRRIFTAWQAIQTAHHGLYSITRLHDLQSYIDTKFSAPRFLALLFGASWPCVVSIVLLDAIPLSPPSREVNANDAFWARSTLSVVVCTLSYVQQTTSMVPMLRLSRKHAIGLTLIATAGAQGCHFVLSLIIGFPVPFSQLLQGPVWLLLVGGYFTTANLYRIRSSRKAQACLNESLIVATLSMSQLVIYPLCSHLFAISSPAAQIALSLLLYLVKTMYRFAIGHFVREYPDRKARMVTFHAEIAHSLFMTFSLQRVNSTSTLVVLLILDALRSTLTLYDVHVRIQRLNRLESIMSKKDPQPGKPMSVIIRTNAIVTRCRLENKFSTSNILRALSTRNINQVHHWQRRASGHKRVAVPPTTSIISGPTKDEVRGVTRIVPITTTSNTTLSRASQKAGFPQLPTRAEADYVEETLQLLRLTEFAILSELIEFLVPVIYTLYVAAAANLPNRAYFPQLAGVTSTGLPPMLLKMIAYGLLELGSLVVLDWQLRRRLCFSPTAQLALELESDLPGVQADLTIWVVHTVQATLMHHGYDYSFKFEWLQK